jgi:signal transduction histidine kinase
MAAAKFQLSILGGRIGSDTAARKTLVQTRQMLKEAIDKSRNLSHELGPSVVYAGTLDAVFEWLAGRMKIKSTQARAASSSLPSPMSEPDARHPMTTAVASAFTPWDGLIVAKTLQTPRRAFRMMS